MSGVNLLLFTELLAVSPAAGRSSYIAAYNLVLGVVAFLAPEFGVACLHLLHMEGTMLLSTLWRLTGATLFIWAGYPRVTWRHKQKIAI